MYIVLQLGGLMDRRKFNGRKRRLKQVPNIVVATSGVDTFMAGEPYRLAPSLKGRIPVKPLRQQGVCVYSGCITKVPRKQSKWCEQHAEEVRKVALKVNRIRFEKKRGVETKRKV